MLYGNPIKDETQVGLITLQQRGNPMSIGATELQPRMYKPLTVLPADFIIIDFTSCSIINPDVTRP